MGSVSSSISRAKQLDILIEMRSVESLFEFKVIARIPSQTMGEKENGEDW